MQQVARIGNVECLHFGSRSSIFLAPRTSYESASSHSDLDEHPVCAARPFVTGASWHKWSRAKTSKAQLHLRNTSRCAWSNHCYKILVLQWAIPCSVSCEQFQRNSVRC